MCYGWKCVIVEIYIYILCIYSRPYQPEIASISPRYMLKGGPEPLENEINEILVSKREDQFSTRFFDWCRNDIRYFFVPASTRCLCKGPRTLRKFPQKRQKIAGCWKWPFMVPDCTSRCWHARRDSHECKSERHRQRIKRTCLSQHIQSAPTWFANMKGKAGSDDGWSKDREGKHPAQRKMKQRGPPCHCENCVRKTRWSCRSPPAMFWTVTWNRVAMMCELRNFIQTLLSATQKPQDPLAKILDELEPSFCIVLLQLWLCNSLVRNRDNNSSSIS